MATVEVERTLVKSPPELWEELATEAGLSRWLGDVRLSAVDPPHRLEWGCEVATGVIELEAAGWGTRVRALADTEAPDSDASEAGGEVRRRLTELLDDLGSSSLSTGS
jgi:hypothetical protein